METYKQEATELWQKYQKALDQGRLSGRFTDAEKCWRFYEGDQWAGIKNSDGKLPFYNIIRPVVNYKKARIAMNAKTITFSLDEQDPAGVMDAINEQMKKAWEFGKMDDRCWEMVETAMVDGDAFLYFPHGSIFAQEEKLCRCTDRRMFAQIRDGCNVFLGNEEEPELQNQPYIILKERKLLEQVRSEAKKNGIPEDDINNILSDERSEADISTNDAIKSARSEQYVTSIIYLERTPEGIRFCRLVKDLIYQPFQVINGLQYYPLVSYTVNRQKGTARGIGEVLPMIPNQIEINRTLVRRSETVKRLAYPKLIYNSSFIANAGDLDVVGASIEVKDDMNVDDVRKRVGYLEPGPISGDATNLENELISITKELAGAGDAALGNINPEQASGAAITAVQDQADVPLNREISAFYQMVEDIAILWYHLIIAYNPTAYQGKNEKVARAALEKICPKMEINISSTIPDTVTARVNTAYSLLSAGYITFEEFMELVGSDSNIPVEKLKSIREENEKSRKRQQMGIMAQQAEDLTREKQEAELGGMMADNEAGGMFAGMMGG